MELDIIVKKLQEPKTKKLLAIGLVVILLSTVLLVVFNLGGGGGMYETGDASIDEMLNIKSVLNDPGEDVFFIASDSDPLYALIATPVAAHYEDNLTIHPLLVYQGFNDRYPYTDTSSSVSKFLANYDVSNDSAVVLGDALHSQIELDLFMAPFEGDPETVSLNFARTFWSQSDAVIMVEPTFWGYSEAVNTVALASYLGIPVIVADQVDEKVATLLEDLGVKYTIICGGVDGYGKTLRHHPSDLGNMNDIAEQRKVADYHQPRITDDTIKVIRERLGGDTNYVTLANPADVLPKQLVMLPGPDGRKGTRDDVPEQLEFFNEGTIMDSSARAYPGAAPSGNDGPSFTFNIPSEYTYANVIMDIKLDVSEATGPLWSYLNPTSPIEKNADGSGERMYAYIGMDKDGDGILDTSEKSEEAQFFGGTPGWGYIRENPDLGYSKDNRPMWAWFKIELPFYNEPMEEHMVQLLGRLPTDPDSSAEYKVKVTVQNMSDPTYPLMHGLSSMAPYLTAYHKGVVLAKETYQVHTPGFIGCASCGNPAADEEAAFASNNEAKVVKSDLNNLLARLAGMDNNPTALAEHYAELARDPNTVQYLAILADPNMVPMYLYPSSQGDPAQGYGIPSDICYQDLDADLDDPPYNMEGGDGSLELAAGRIGGWDVQDASALVARNVFYDRIIETYKGPLNTDVPLPSQKSLAPLWKDSAVTTVGTEPPIGSAYPTTTKIAWMFEQSGMTTNKKPWNLQNQESRRQYAGEFYESANFLYFCAHGFYYWYVPTAQEGYLGIASHTGGGGAFDVAHVKDMNLGPGVIFGSSCVTGRIDGLPGRNTLSQAFMHAGLNAYVGATRMSWGSLIPIPNDAEGEVLGNLIAVHFYGDLTGYIYDKQGTDNEHSETSVGFALMDAKNKYITSQGGSDGGGVVSDTYEEFNLHGDPAFVPYIPNAG